MNTDVLSEAFIQAIDTIIQRPPIPGGFNVTYEVVHPSEPDVYPQIDRGFIAKDLLLSEAIAKVLESDSNTVDGGYIETDGDWITVDHGTDYTNGQIESRGLHPPEWLTAEQWQSIQEIFDHYGANANTL